MARESTRTSSTAQDRPRPAAAIPEDQAVAATRTLMSHPLGAAQDAVHALLQLQAQQARALRAWAQTVDEALHEVQAVRDLPGLVAVMINLAGRQYSVASSQWAEGWSQWFEGEVQLADRLRAEASSLLQDLQQPMPGVQRRDDSDAEPWMQTWSRMQDQWRVATQHWIDATQAGTTPH